MNTKHANIRAQQRGVAVLASRYLDEYGRTAYSGHGTMILYFDKGCFREIEGDLGHEATRRAQEWRDAYKVVIASSGTTITIGHRYRKIWRK